MGEPANILLEEFDSFLHVQVGKLTGAQGSQDAASLVESIKLLLLLGFRCDVAAQGDQMRDPAGVGSSRHRSNVQLQIVIVAAVKARGNSLAGKGCLEGREFRPEIVRRVKNVVDAAAGGMAAVPAVKRRIGP